MLPDSGSIAIDASTTLVHLASAVSSTHLDVVTNGWTTFDVVRGRPGVRPYLTGGQPEEHNASLVGSLAVKGITSFHFDRVFMSTMSIDPVSGTSEPTMPQLDVKRAMAAVSADVVVAVDSSKVVGGVITDDSLIHSLAQPTAGTQALRRPTVKPDIERRAMGRSLHDG